MFSKDTYIRRRQELKKLVGKGVIILLLFGDDIDVEDIVWMGYTPSVADLAAEVGISKTAPMKDLAEMINSQWSLLNKHFLPPYRFDTKIQIMDLLGIHPNEQKEKASLALIQAVVKMRSTKEAQEIEAIERACDVGYAMHTTAQLLIRPGVTPSSPSMARLCMAIPQMPNSKQDGWPSAMPAVNSMTIAPTTLVPCPSTASSRSASWRSTPSSRPVTTMCSMWQNPA